MNQHAVYTGQTFALDIEVYPNYVLIAFKHVETKHVIIFEASANSIINVYDLAFCLQSFKIITFNGIRFDIPICWLMYAHNSIDAAFSAAQDLIVNNMRERELCEKYHFTNYDINHIDLIEVAPLKGSLKTYAGRLHAKRIQDLPYDPTVPLTYEQAEQVKDYCINSDIDATILMYDNLQEQLALRADLSKEYSQNLMSKSDAQIAEAVIASELRKLSGKRIERPKLKDNWSHRYIVPTWLSFKTPLLQGVLETVRAAIYTLDKGGSPQVPKSITDLDIRVGTSRYRMGNGGLHSTEERVHHVADDKMLLIDRDVASYYPAIVLNNDLYPQHMGRDFFKVYQGLVDKRLEAKAAKQTAIADALKITINGSFGKLGSQYSILYSPDLLIQVTVTGQLALLMLIESIELVGIQVVSANTDGIVIKCPHIRRYELEACLHIWEQQTNFVTEETNYKAIYSRDCNSYVAIKNDNTVKGKGAYGNPWANRKEYIFRFHRNPNTTICVEAACAHMLNGTSIEHTIKSSKDITKFVSVRKVDGGAEWRGYYLGKTVRWYYAMNHFEPIKYARNGNKVPDTEGAKPMMLLPDEMPTDINYTRYIEKTIDILHDLTFLEAPSKKVTFFD